MRGATPLLFATALLLQCVAGAAALQLPTLADFDAATLRGTEGFFRVGRTQAGQWWLLTPDNSPFFSKGVAGVNRAGTQGGRRALRGPYAAAVDQKYGTEDVQPFVSATLQRLRDWNFNTLGAWVTSEFFDQGMPYTEIVEFRYSAPAMIKTSRVDLPDVFDPRWEASCDKKAAEICAPRRESRQLIGYFTDNEYDWGQPKVDSLLVQTKRDETARPELPLLLQVCLSLEPSWAAHGAAWDFVRELYGQDSALAKAWGFAPTERAAIMELLRNGHALLGGRYLKDNEQFSRRFARRYFATTAAAIRKYDPNHLILGCRFGAPPGRAILQECVVPHVDVLSANNYNDRFYERLNNYYDVSKMPILVGEFSWASGYFVDGPLETALPATALKEQMQTKGRNSLKWALMHPGLVGYTWYRWVQGDPAKIPPYSYGLVYTNDETAEEHVSVVREINLNAESLRLDAGKIRE